MELKEIQEIIKAQNITSLRVEFPDLYGISRSKMMPAKHVERVAEEGLCFAQAIYGIHLGNDVAEGSGVGYEIDWKDMSVMPDLDTFTVLPYLEGTARLIGNGVSGGNPVPVDPRNCLQRILKQYDDMGLKAICASELEFFLFEPNGAGSPTLYNPNLSTVYQIGPGSDKAGFLQKLQNTLLDVGIDILYMNHEFFPSQYEINWMHGEALKMADDSFTFKTVCKEMAALNNLLLTFMGRPTTDGGGSGYHIHLSLNDHETGKNLFDDPSGENGISDLARYFIGGQMAHAKGMSALFAPTINSYKRYVPDSFCPYYMVWGLDNRSVYCRVPDERGAATRVENRAPCASANPYLVFAAAFAAGLDGIKNKIEPGDPFIGDVGFAEPGTLDTVPFYLRDSLAELKADKVLCDAIGPELIQAFVALKENELDRFRKHVTDWEFNEYSSLL
ncbi:MAG: glutamine synthetase [Desulfobacula sp.]|jgi:glutamine synthetase|uniref:glutamine synthetase family protein n=1 Tax=Desulfobacula sp. TaxID=2593537 RepID=UPI001D23164A|nr:glutamine synthetase [Desulfobacula sp.]MBT3485754.1 glutamine synthetase [Desulfobacula sp.]MBT3803378.1 glutamine synthetase [Desulfobacula sp.]MBT4024299.1 glutamine synthetase [Desulfobacula sp.]MBT4198306.1 glutamine synthetase [Desulfobacula sp.]